MGIGDSHLLFVTIAQSKVPSWSQTRSAHPLGACPRTQHWWTFVHTNAHGSEYHRILSFNPGGIDLLRYFRLGSGRSRLFWASEVSLLSNVPAGGPLAGLIGPPNADPAEFLKQAFGRVKNVLQPDQDPVVVHQIFLEISCADGS